MLSSARQSNLSARRRSLLLVGASLLLLAQLDPNGSTTTANRPGLDPPQQGIALAAPVEQEACPEPNNGFAQACAVTPPVNLTGFIDTATDIDAYVVRVNSSTRLVSTLTELPADYDLHLYTATAQLIAESQAEGNVDEHIEAQIDTPGNYFIFVNSGRGGLSATSPYRLTIELVAPPGQTAPAGPAPGAGATQPAAGPAAFIDSIDNARVVLQRADGSKQDGAPVGTALGPGDSVATVGSGAASLRLLGSSTLRLNRDSAVALIKLDRAGDGTQSILVEQTRGRANHQVGLPNGGSSYTVLGFKSQLVAHGTAFDSEVRDIGQVLFDCLDCDPNKVQAVGRPPSSGQRLAVVPTGEIFVLKLYEEPPDLEEERRREEEERRNQEHDKN